MVETQKLDPISEWLLKNGFELTRKNWCELHWGFDKSAEEIRELVEGRGNGEELAEIPSYLPARKD